mmetsp:Transcript_8566/g.16992  ORF Transcript_8566/g.16992 Transcript_8566/m.16992 type:complete len:720 (-) Transcript_8566:403-2562(-)
MAALPGTENWPEISFAERLREVTLVSSELVIALCYFVIPALIFWYTRGIQVAALFLKVRIWFMLFIVCCGLTHFFGFLGFWYIMPNLVVLGKLATATVSVGTVCILLNYMSEIQTLMARASALERSVEKATSQLISLKTRNEELARLKEEAIRLATMRQEFISTVSHEVRTPLQSIIGFGEILEQSDLDPSQQQMLKTMLESSRMLCTIINDILDFSKYQKDDFVLEDEPFPIMDAIISSLRISSNRATSKGVTLRYKICNRVPAIVRGDLTRIVQILSNLISNGVKFTPEGAVSVHVNVVESKYVMDAWLQDFFNRPCTFTPVQPSTASDFASIDGVATKPRTVSETSISSEQEIPIRPSSPTENSKLLESHLTPPCVDSPRKSRGHNKDLPYGKNREGPWGIMLQVIDSGVGVAPESFNRIFRRFMQSDTSTTRMFGGTGLGLSIVQQLASRMGGTIHVESVQGKGSIFTVFLQLKPTEDSPLLTPSTSYEVLPPPSISPKTDRVEKGHKPVDIATVEDALQQSNSEVESKAAAASESEVPRPKSLPKTPPKSAKSNPTKSQVPVTPHRARRVLLVDDNEINRAVTKPMLHKAGVPDVNTASNGQQAYEELENMSEPYDAVLLDLHMPVMDGYTTVEKIRANLPSIDNIPIFAFTAASFDNKESQELREKGFSGIVTKPCTLARIKKALDLTIEYKEKLISEDELFTRSEMICSQRN